jgi:hypothetical protein
VQPGIAAGQTELLTDLWHIIFFIHVNARLATGL